MCGICGVVGNTSRGSSEQIVRRMMSAMHHRGPDDEGMLVAQGAVLGMRRLSIIDLPGGTQPIWNQAETLAVIFNGEIYNFREIRAQLEACGHRFRTRSDTEAIVHAYEKWGADCVRRLHGMFAFAIAEFPQGTNGLAAKIFLARDPMGIKPLYYTEGGDNFLFASEVRTLLASGCINPQLSPAAIHSYLLFGSVCEPLTLVNGIRSLPPGHCMTIEPDRLEHIAGPRPFWSGAGVPQDSNGGKQNVPSNGSRRPATAVRALLEKAVASHLVADVPVGVFLSSGLDSTAVAALASRTQGGIHTFTVAFPDIEFNEAEIARRTAASLGTQHLELMLSGDEMVSRLGEAAGAFDQPSMDGINTYFVSWAARQAGLKVALSGLGSDELFGGYESFRATRTAARAGELGRLFPSPVRAIAAGALSRISGFGYSPDRLRKASAAFSEWKVLPHPYFFTRLLFTPQTLASHLHEECDSWTREPWWDSLSDSAREAEEKDDFTAISWLEFRSYLLNTLLRDTDAMSMANSLEVRVPFLDTPLVEYVLSLPESAKMDARPKALLIAALEDVLPPEVVAQKKRTFTFPWANWLRGPLGERVGEALAEWSPALAPHVDGEFASTIWREFQHGKTSWSRPWSLYVLNEWVKRNLVLNRAASAECDPAAVA